MSESWAPKPGFGADERIAHVEQGLLRLFRRQKADRRDQDAAAAVQQALPAGSATPTEGSILEEEITFNDVEGHDHNSVGTAVPLTGDVTGTNQGAQVTGIRGHSVPDPGETEDLLFLQFLWGGGSPSVTWARPGSRQTLDGWTQTDVPAAQAAVVLARTVPFYALRAGSITGVAVRSNEARTAGTLEVEVYVDGVATGLKAVLDAANTSFHAATQTAGLDMVAAGQLIELRITTSADWAPTTADVQAALEIET